MPLIAFLEGLPLWLLAIVLNVWLMGSVLVGLRIFRRHVLPRLGINFNNAYYVAPLMQSSVLLYGLIAALTAVGAPGRGIWMSRGSCPLRQRRSRYFGVISAAILNRCAAPRETWCAATPIR